MNNTTCAIDADGFCTVHGWDCQDFHLHLKNPETDMHTAPDWSTHERVIAALGPGDPLSDDQLQILNILVDPNLDPEGISTLEDLLDSYQHWSAESGEINDIAYRLELHHRAHEADRADCWWFYYDNDDSGWYEVGSRLKDQMLHVTQGEDGKYLYGPRYGLDGLRAAIHAAQTINDTWLSTRQQMLQLGLLAAPTGE